MKRLFIYHPDKPGSLPLLLAEIGKFLVSCGRRMHIIITEPSRTREQEKKYHAIFKQFAKHKTARGKKRSKESWKRLLIAAFRHDTEELFASYWSKFGDWELIPSLHSRDEVVAVGEQSRNFSVPVANAFIEWLEALYVNSDTEVAYD